MKKRRIPNRPVRRAAPTNPSLPPGDSDLVHMGAKVIRPKRKLLPPPGLPGGAPDAGAGPDGGAGAPPGAGGGPGGDPSALLAALGAGGGPGGPGAGGPPVSPSGGQGGPVPGGMPGGMPPRPIRGAGR